MPVCEVQGLEFVRFEGTASATRKRRNTCWKLEMKEVGPKAGLAGAEDARIFEAEKEVRNG